MKIMLNKQKVETSSELPRKSSANFVYFCKSLKNAQKRSYRLQTTLGQFLVIFGLENARNRVFLPR